jgi:hypothetical protein
MQLLEANMVDENLSEEEFAQFFKEEVLASIREYEANPHDVYTLEEVRASMRELFAEAEAHGHAKKAA